MAVNLPYLSSSEITELENHSWKVDCISITLKDRSDDPEKLYGPGMIYQTNNGSLRFKLYVTRKKRRQKRVSSHLKAGQLIPDSAYFELLATDCSGRIWKSERIFLRSTPFLENAVVIDEQLSEILCTQRIPKNKLTFKNDSLSYWVFEDIEIPCNEQTIERMSVAGRRAGSSGKLNAWKFRTQGINFLVVKHDEKMLTIRATTKLGKTPCLLEERILESLQFVLGRPIPWSVIQKQKQQTVIVKISSPRKSEGKSRFSSPLPARSLTEPGKRKITTKYHRKLFECYLKHSLTTDKKRHPIWGYLNAVYEAGRSSFIDSEALAFVVAIEGLVHTEFSGLVTLSVEDKNAISELEKYIDNWDGEATIKKRAKGAVSQFYNIRVNDIMLKLEELGAITPQQRKNWGSLRNPSAHAFQTDKLSGEKIRELLPSVKMLLYHLIFYAIDYQGFYMDIASLDWPLKEYKPNKK